MTKSWRLPNALTAAIALIGVGVGIAQGAWSYCLSQIVVLIVLRNYWVYRSHVERVLTSWDSVLGVASHLARPVRHD